VFIKGVRTNHQKSNKSKSQQAEVEKGCASKILTSAVVFRFACSIGDWRD